MRPYLLLTPGPLTTSETVKEAMMSDWCTWDEDYNVGIVEKIRKELVTLATSRPEDYTAVLMQGSGTFCVESTLGTDSPEERMVEHIALREAIDQLPEREKMTILLRFFKGLTQEQTARILGVSQVQISRLERRGLADLRRLLDG